MIWTSCRTVDIKECINYLFIPMKLECRHIKLKLHQSRKSLFPMKGEIKMARPVQAKFKLCEKGSSDPTFPGYPLPSDRVKLTSDDLTAIQARLNYQEGRISMNFQISDFLEYPQSAVRHAGALPLSN